MSQVDFNLGILLDKTEPGSRIKVFIDSASALYNYTNADDVNRFLATLGAKVKGLGGSLFFSLGDKIISPDNQRRVEDTVDGIVQLRSHKDPALKTKEFRIRKMRGKEIFSEWLPYYIGEKTIFLGLPQDPDELARLKQAFEKGSG